MAEVASGRVLEVDPSGSREDFKDTKSSKLQQSQETCLPPQLCLWIWLPGETDVVYSDSWVKAAAKLHHKRFYMTLSSHVAQILKTQKLRLKISVVFQVHHGAYCLATAVATKRTLVFSSKHWKYSKCHL